MKIFPMLLLIGFAVFAVQAQTTRVIDELALEPGVAKHVGLDEVYRKFSKAYRELDSAAFSSLYTADAAYLVPGDTIQIGGVDIIKSFESFFSSIRSKNGKLTISFNIVQRKAEKSMAYDVGVYTLRTFSKDNVETGSGRGKFVVVAVRDGDTWRFQVDGYSDMPADKPKQ